MTTIDERLAPPPELTRVRGRARAERWSLPGEPGSTRLAERVRGICGPGTNRPRSWLAEDAERRPCRGPIRRAGRPGCRGDGDRARHRRGRRRRGILINTSRMREVSVDPEARRARVARRCDLAGRGRSRRRAARIGRAARIEHRASAWSATPWAAGSAGSVARYGLAAHSVTAAEVVTADGDLCRIGAGRAPGAVLGDPRRDRQLRHRHRTGVRPAPGAARCTPGTSTTRWIGLATSSISAAEWSVGTCRNLTAAVTFRSFPPVPAMPEALRGRSFVALARLLLRRPEHGAGADRSGPGGAGAGGGRHLRRDPAGSAWRRSAWIRSTRCRGSSHTELLADLTPAAIDARARRWQVRTRGSPLAMLEVRQLGGALAGPPDALSPMAHTTAVFSVNAIGVTPTRSRHAAVRAHLARVATGSRPHVTGDTYHQLPRSGRRHARTHPVRLLTGRPRRRLLAIKRALRPAQRLPLQPQHPHRRVLDPTER